MEILAVQQDTWDVILSNVAFESSKGKSLGYWLDCDCERSEHPLSYT